MIANKIKYVSNLHRHDLKKITIKPNKPYLAICGNVGDVTSKEYTQFFDTVCKDFERVFFVPGVQDYLAAAPHMYFEGLQVHNKNLQVLVDQSVDLENGKVVGSILWPRMTAMTAMYEGHLFNIVDQNGEYMTPTKINRFHQANVAFLTKELVLEPKETIVLTNFSPTHALNPDASNPEYLPRVASYIRGVNMEHLFGTHVTLWFVGVPGTEMEITINNTRICSKPY